MQDSTVVKGTCDARFSEVRAEFEANFARRGEVGASVALIHDGDMVVDLWGGLSDTTQDRSWERDTVSTVFSSTKGVAAACLHVLIDRGLLDPDAPVATYWPEFAANGKSRITVAMVMSHQAGLPYWQEPLPDGALYDWDLAAARLAQEAPIWEPGTTHGYHAMTLGFLEGEILRRITGTTIGAFLRRELADPLQADVWIGLPEQEDHRAARMILPEPTPGYAMYDKMLSDPEWQGAKMLSNTGGYLDDSAVNSRAHRAAEVPAAGGVANARGLARLYAPFALGGSFESVQVVSPNAAARMGRIRSASSCDLSLRLPTTFTLGFSNIWGDRRMGAGNHAIVAAGAFGTVGWGGSFGFADPKAGMSIAYTMNRLGESVALNDRGQSLIDAAYRALGHSLNTAGEWEAA